MNRILTGTLLAASLILTACGDDDNTPAEKFSFEGQTEKLNDSNIYLVDEDGNDQYTYRDYIITDGTYTDGDGWDLEDYNDATFLLAVELGVSAGDGFTKGEYPMFDSFNDATGNASYLYYVTGIGQGLNEYYTPEDVVNGEEVTVTGGVDNGDVMKIKFNGILTRYHYVSEDEVEEAASGKFYFQGKVQDVRVVLGKKAQNGSFRGGVKNR